MHILGRPWTSLLSLADLPLSSGGTLPTPIHPTLVVRRNSKTAPAALTSHSGLTEGVRGRSHWHTHRTVSAHFNISQISDSPYLFPGH